MTREAGGSWVMKYGQYGLPLRRMPRLLLERVIPSGGRLFEFTPGYLGTRFLTRRELDVDQLAIIALSDVPVKFTHKLDYSNATDIMISLIIIFLSIDVNGSPLLLIHYVSVACVYMPPDDSTLSGIGL